MTSTETLGALGRVIDTHVHFWDTSRLNYPWLSSEEAQGLPAKYVPDDLLQASRALDLAAVVHVQAEVDHTTDPVAETVWMQELHEQTGLPTVCIGYADLRTHDLAETLDRHQRFSLFRGIRQEAWFDPTSKRADLPTSNLLDNPRFALGLRELEKRNLVFELLVWPAQLAQAAQVLAATPELGVMINHIGVPVDGDLARWADGLSAVFEATPRAHLKISGLGFLTAVDTPSILDPIIEQALSIAGANRIVFASNFPAEPPGWSYPAIWGTFARALESATAPERRAMLHDNAADFYRIPL